MKLLAIADEPVPALWDHYAPERTAGCDLIVSCGDLPAEYLSFLVTMSNLPLLYIHGNHDGNYLGRPPEGCVCVDDAMVRFHGLRILGLGGSPDYGGGPFQYSERQMLRRVRRLRWAVQRAGGVDLVLTHAPPYGVGDLEDPAHRGFRALLELLDRYRPAWLFHGHIHPRYVPGLLRERTYADTRVLNVCERQVLELPDRIFPERERGQVVWLTRHRERRDEL